MAAKKPPRSRTKAIVQAVIATLVVLGAVAALGWFSSPTAAPPCPTPLRPSSRSGTSRRLSLDAPMGLGRARRFKHEMPV